MYSIRELTPQVLATLKEPRDLESLKYVSTMWDAQMRYFLRALKTMNWNRTKTAAALGVSLRTVRVWILYLKDHGVAVPDSRARGGNRRKKAMATISIPHDGTGTVDE